MFFLLISVEKCWFNKYFIHELFKVTITKPCNDCVPMQMAALSILDIYNMLQVSVDMKE